MLNSWPVTVPCSQPNAVQSWTYDAAGNRTSDYTGTSWSYDNLNRMTVSPGATYTNDILGNRLTKGPASYGWDCLNRMVSYMNGSANETYGYRADGMRTFKSNSGSTTVYRYDGQMGMEDVDLAGSNTTVTDYGLGARGIDYISSSVNGGGANISFPVYDAHGNMVATLARNGGGTYQVSNQRAYGAWGEIRQGTTTGDPKGRYCANLGHKQDDESGLTYMRARYYDGVSGRFVSQDIKYQQYNRFIYCGDEPVDRFDESGGGWDIWSTLGYLSALLDLIGIAIVCSLAVPVALVVALIVLDAVLIVVTTIHTFGDTIAMFLKAIEPHMKEIKKWENEDLNLILPVIDDFKASGNVFVELLACDVEDEIYLNDCYE